MPTLPVIRFRIPNPESRIPVMATEAQTIAELSREQKARETTAEAVLARCLQRINERNGTLNAFITSFEQSARARAREADHEIRAGQARGALQGLPLTSKMT